MLFVSILLSTAFSFPLQSAAAHVGPASGSTFYLSLTGLSCTFSGCPPSPLPAPCDVPPPGQPSYLAFVTGNMSHSLPGRSSDVIGLSSDAFIWTTGFCTNMAYGYPSLASISSISLTLRVSQATQPWIVSAGLYDLGTVSNPASTPMLLAGGSGNFAAFTPILHPCLTSKVLNIPLTPVEGAQLTSGHLLGLQLEVGGYTAGSATLCFGQSNPLSNSISSISIK